MWTKLLTTLIALALVAASCGNDDDGGTEPSPGAGQATEVVDEADAETDGEGASADETARPVANRRCVYLDNYIAAQPGTVFDPTLDPQPIRLDIAGLRIRGLIGTSDSADVDAAFNDSIEVYELPDGTDPLPFTRDNELEGQAGPIHVYGFEGHVVFLPGGQVAPVTAEIKEGAREGDIDLTYPINNGVDYPEAGGTFAVVDTGLDPELFSGLPPLANGSTITGDAEAGAYQNEEHLRGHGTFVASLLAQLRPGSQVRVEMAAPTQVEVSEDGQVPVDIVWPGTPPGTDERRATDRVPTTTGTAVHYAVQELLAAGTSWDALVLPLGTPPCWNPADIDGSQQEYSEMVVDDAFALRGAIDEWHAHTDRGDNGTSSTVGSPVFAAAGSSGSAYPLLPGGFSDVTSVAATQWAEDGESSDHAHFDRGESNQGDVLAPGSDLIGFRSATEVVVWGGTSFATPVAATAGTASSPGPSPSYVEYPGLRFLADEMACLVDQIGSYSCGDGQ